MRQYLKQQSYDIIIADTSFLISLSKIGEIELLRKLFNKVSITSTIAMEFHSELPIWIEVIDNQSDKKIKLLEQDLDKGESSAIALALELDNPLLIIDDLKARKLSKKLQINFIGTIAVLIKSIELGFIKDKRKLIEKIRSTNFHFSDELLKLLESH